MGQRRVSIRRPVPGAMYGPETVSWRVNRETVLLLGGPRALLMQLAHPKVAAGVADHSGFEADPFGRLRRTLEVMTTVGFAPPDDAAAALRALEARHQRVRGALPDGDPYSALDPELLWWVLATLIDTALTVERRYLGRLGDAERVRFYEESARMADAFAIPAEVRPPDFAAFERYMDDAVRSLPVSDVARRLAGAIVRPPVPLLGALAAPVLRAVTADLLPAPLRRAYGLDGGGFAGRTVALSQVVSRALLPLVPTAWRVLPAALAGTAMRTATRAADGSTAQAVR